MKPFHAWPCWLLGSTSLSDPYQTASAIPFPPAFSQGKTLVASPVAVRPSLTCTAGLHLVQPVEALEALTNVCRSAGFELLMVQTAKRFRLASMETTENRVSGDPVGVSAILTSFFRSWLPPPASSRKSSVPVLSG